jgi:hypothetical protein
MRKKTEDKKSHEIVSICSLPSIGLQYENSGGNTECVVRTKKGNLQDKGPLCIN